MGTLAEAYSPERHSYTQQENRIPQLSLYSETSNKQTSTPLPEKNLIQISIGFSLAPYVLENSKGLLGEIITEALQAKGYKAKFHFMTNSQALKHFESGGSDAVAVVRDGMSTGILSNPVITFNNVAIALRQHHYKITKIEDLKEYALAGFSNAKHYLGTDFFEMAEKNKNYVEIPKQKSQIKALFDGDVDFIVADETIFRFNQNTLTHEFTFDGKYREKVNYYRLFNPIPYYVAFSNEEHVKAFNEGLDTVIKNGKVTRIYQKYTELLDKY